jgi:hypothetical protein
MRWVCIAFAIGAEGCFVQNNQPFAVRSFVA